VIAYADESEGELIFQTILGLVSIALIGWFVSGLYARVRRLPSQTAPALVLIGGTAFALLVFLAMTIWSAPLIDFPGEGEADAMAEAYLLIDDIGWVTLGGAGVGAALMAIAASVAALRAGAVPAWLGWLGAIAGLLSAATVAFFGIFAWMAWILVASILMLYASSTRGRAK
jgi:hypothetical protein